MLKQITRRENVTVDDRRAVIVIANARKPRDVAEVGHEQFIRRALKTRLGWPQREPAPESVKKAAREMAAHLVLRDKVAADQQAAKDAAVAQGIADNV